MLDSGGTEGGSPQLMQALQAQQQAAKTSHGSSSPGALGASAPHPGLAGHTAPGAASHAPATPPREVGSIAEELITRPVQDFGTEVKSWFDINAWFGIKTTDTPEEQQRKQALFTRYQQLTQEQQHHFQARLQREHQRKTQMAEEQQMADQRKQAQAVTELPQPTGQRKGPGSDMQPQKKSHKQTMTNTVTKNRQSFNKVQSSG